MNKNEAAHTSFMNCSIKILELNKCARKEDNYKLFIKSEYKLFYLKKTTKIRLQEMKVMARGIGHILNIIWDIKDVSANFQLCFILL
jgi:hypothetical protein